MAKRTKTGGRKAGTPNKVTTDLRTAIMRAFDKAGGEAYLFALASAHPQVFCTLLGKILPAVVAGDADSPILHKIIREIVRPANHNG